MGGLSPENRIRLGIAAGVMVAGGIIGENNHWWGLFGGKEPVKSQRPPATQHIEIYGMPFGMGPAVGEGLKKALGQNCGVLEQNQNLSVPLPGAFVNVWKSMGDCGNGK